MGGVAGAGSGWKGSPPGLSTCTAVLGGTEDTARGLSGCPFSPSFPGRAGATEQFRFFAAWTEAAQAHTQHVGYQRLSGHLVGHKSEIMRGLTRGDLASLPLPPLRDVSVIH